MCVYLNNKPQNNQTRHAYTHIHMHRAHKHIALTTRHESVWQIDGWPDLPADYKHRDDAGGRRVRYESIEFVWVVSEIQICQQIDGNACVRGL